jgi:NAD(P)-dependent dehydrogenase (short-subunit alcohol dehydrogenase family)
MACAISKIVERGKYMRDFDGKTAFVTGGASGIGLAMGRAFLDLGMKVMLADVETSALDQALQNLSNHGNRVQGIHCDVGDPESVARAAQATFDAFGYVHLVCNNAGVAAGGGIDNI